MQSGAELQLPDRVPVIRSACTATPLCPRRCSWSPPSSCLPVLFLSYSVSLVVGVVIPRSHSREPAKFAVRSLPQRSGIRGRGSATRTTCSPRVSSSGVSTVPDLRGREARHGHVQDQVDWPSSRKMDQPTCPLEKSCTTSTPNERTAHAHMRVLSSSL